MKPEKRQVGISFLSYCTAEYFWSNKIWYWRIESCISVKVKYVFHILKFVYDKIQEFRKIHIDNERFMYLAFNKKH